MPDYEAICAIDRFTPSGAEDASYRCKRAHNQSLGHPEWGIPAYPARTLFEYVFQSGTGNLWVKDPSGTTVFFPRGEIQCLLVVEGEQ